MFRSIPIENEMQSRRDWKSIFPRNRTTFKLTTRPILRASARNYLTLNDASIRPRVDRLTRIGSNALTGGMVRTRSSKLTTATSTMNHLTAPDNAVSQRKGKRRKQISDNNDDIADDRDQPPTSKSKSEISISPPAAEKELPDPNQHREALSIKSTRTFHSPSESVSDATPHSEILEDALIVIDDFSTIPNSYMSPQERKNEQEQRLSFIRVLFQEKSNHNSLHTLILDQSFFPTKSISGDHVRAIRQNADFFLLHVNSAQQIRSLLTSVSSGVGYDALNNIVAHSLISPTSTANLHSLSDFRLSLPSLLISNTADTNPHLRIR